MSSQTPKPKADTPAGAGGLGGGGVNQPLRICPFFLKVQYNQGLVYGFVKLYRVKLCNLKRFK